MVRKLSDTSDPSVPLFWGQRELCCSELQAMVKVPMVAFLSEDIRSLAEGLEKSLRQGGLLGVCRQWVMLDQGRTIRQMMGDWLKGQSI